MITNKEDMPEGELVVERAELVSDPKMTKGVTVEITLRDSRYRRYTFRVSEFANRLTPDPDNWYHDTKYQEPRDPWEPEPENAHEG